MARPLPIAVLVSGEGTTLDGLAELALGRHLNARIVLVVADRAGTRAIERARVRGLPTVVVASRGSAARDWSERLTRELEAQGVELVVLAGFLSILPPPWLERWRGRVINIHPSLLPRYGGPGMYGRRVLEATLASGDAETGATVHLVTDEVDGGPTIAAARIPVRPTDDVGTLRARLHPIEVNLLAETIDRFSEGALPLPYPERDAPAAGRRDRPDARG